MSGTRSRRAVWTFATMFLFTVSTTATGLLITPILIRLLGETRFGASRVLIEYAGYLTLLDLGLGGALSPLLARALAKHDEVSLRGTLAAGLRLYAAITGVILVLGLAVTPIMPALMKQASDLSADIKLAWVVTVLGFLPLITLPFKALADAEQKGYLINTLYSLQAVLVAVVAVALAYFNFGVTGQALATASVTAGMGLFLSFLVLRRHRGRLALITSPPDPEARAALRKLGGPTLAVNLSGRISLMTDNIVVGMILGTGPVTLLFVAQRLAVMAQAQLLGVGNAAWAGLADLHARGEHDTFNRRLVELTRLVTVLGVATLGPIVAFNRAFVNWWTPTTGYGGDHVTLIASINALLLALTSLWGYGFGGTGRISVLVRPAAVGAVINLIASATLTWKLGIVGPLLGTTIATMSVSLWFLPLQLRNQFGTSTRALFRAVAVPLAFGIPYSAALWWVSRQTAIPGLLLLASEMSASAAAFLAFSAAALLSATDRATWRARLANAIPIRRRPEPVTQP